MVGFSREYRNIPRLIRHIVTKRGEKNHEVRQVLQSGAKITKQGITSGNYKNQICHDNFRVDSLCLSDCR